MLETRNIVKVYKPKKGVPVTALDGVSLRFPERGMVFLLGKSGSGKSTLLNLLGGLDNYDSGEIIIKGVSSRNFSQTRFDSYRNTYVGFIFQDYNVLEEFNVGANIALALELQGKKATDEEINRILAEVDLSDYGNRRPNELSGGQLQRVAIARALVKNPEIIMADEPTGALDSNTGKQVFDTLKKLSAEKLVIIVSHDREYAEYYADRIIELADGRVISDVEHTPEEDGSDSLSFSGDTVTIPQGYHLTDEDKNSINAYIDKLRSGARLSISGVQKKFRKTDTSTIPEQDPSKFALIKSRLPLKSAFRIGASGLKYKKFRLFMTIMLSVVAFSLFALTDTFGAYNNITACTESIMKSDISYLSMQKAKKFVYGTTIGGVEEYSWRTGYSTTKEELEQIKRETGLSLTGLYSPRDMNLSFTGYIDREKLSSLNSSSLSGFVELDEESINELGYKLAEGRLPDSTKDEIALTRYSAESFILGGFIKVDGEGNISYDKISSPTDLLGHKLTFDGSEFEIVGIVDTNFDFDRYEPLIDETAGENDIGTYMLHRELYYSQNFSFNTAVFVGDGKIDEFIKNRPAEIPLWNSNFYMSYYDESSGSGFDISPGSVGRLSDIKDDVIWADGKPRDTLAENELIISDRTCHIFGDSYDTSSSETGTLSEDAIKMIFAASFEMYYYGSGNGESETVTDARVVGIIMHKDDTESASSYAIYTSDGLYDKLTADEKGEYSLVLGTMPKDRGEVEKIVNYCYKEDGSIRFEMLNPVTYELDNINKILTVLASVFVWIGVGFAVFAAVMLANFIGTSIAYKKQEIGILRAIGSRSSDVFNIFFAEAFIISTINFLLSAVGTFIATLLINWFVKDQFGVLIELLSFGPRQVALVLAVSLGIAALACFLPVKKIASKRPIDAIRGR